MRRHGKMVSTIKSIILGVDVGIHGGIAAYDTESREVVAAKPMPVLKKVGGKDRIDVHALGFYLDAYASHILFAVVEEPNAMPNQGVVSMFRFGHACGIVEGCLGALQIPMMLVKPAVWKSAMGLNSDKERSLAMARDYFPSQAQYFQRKKDDGMAEAALLAVYGEKFASIVTNTQRGY